MDREEDVSPLHMKNPFKKKLLRNLIPDAYDAKVKGLSLANDLVKYDIMFHKE